MTQGRIHANLPSRDFDATAAFYERLGFDVTYRGGDWMAMARDGMVIEFFPHPELVPEDSWFSACLWHSDIDMVFEEWSNLGISTEAPGFPRISGKPFVLDGPLRLFCVHDPDGSLWRVLEQEGET